jgi:hypothetical protein
VSAILDYPLVHSLPVDKRRPAPPARRGRPVTLRQQAEVVALRRRQAIAVGCLAGRGAVGGDRLVSAADVAGHLWWIPAGAVWSDADADSSPERPHPVGVAMAATREAALVKGLSDRLGWEAVLELGRGDLAVAEAIGTPPLANALVLDGRLGHDVPTVVVLAAETVRWGAASTWDGALRRALYGDDADVDPASELASLCELLGDDLGVASVDLGTPVLSDAGVVRCSVQLVAGDATVRSWDAP